MNDLATLLRDDVASTEPTTGLDAMVPVRLGRRRLHTRRLVSGVAAAVVVGVGTAVAVPLVHDDSAGRSRGIDPISQKALDDYDAQAMPQLMDDRARAVLERSVPGLGPSTFRASSDDVQALSPDRYDQASAMAVTFGTGDHQFEVDLAHSKSEAEGSAQRYCADGLSGGYYLECMVDTTTDGDVVISKLQALRPMKGGDWMIVRSDQLGTVNQERLWFDHEVKVIKSETFVTYVDERVRAATREAAEAAFQAPMADLAEIGTDPVLVIPSPH
jgi:hypothetical protein